MSWHIPVLDSLLVLFFFAALGLRIFTVIFNRFIFAGYVKKHHSGVYERLTTAEARFRAGRLITDASREMQQFRAQGEDLGDPELARLRRISRRLTKGTVGGFLVIALLIALYATLRIAALRP